MTATQELVGKLEELMMRISDGEKAAVSELYELVKEPSDLDEAAAETIVDNLEMVIPDPQAAADDPALADLVLLLAKRGLESMILRDTIAALARSQNSDYLDPAGMIRGLGVLDERIDIRAVCDRFDMFSFLTSGTRVWHDSFGFGEIRDIDPLGDQVHIEFNSRQSFTLKQVLANLNVIRPDSLVDKLLRKTESFGKSMAPEVFDREAAYSCVPPLVSPRLMVEAVLVPTYLGPREFIAWRDHASDSNTSAKRNAATSKRATASTPATEITWETARGVEELRIYLKKARKLQLQPEHREHFRKIYSFAASRSRFDADFAFTLAQLQRKAGGQEIMQQVIQDLPEDSHVWSSAEAFGEATMSLPAKKLEDWLTVCWLAKGKEWYLTNVTELPLKYWTAAENVLNQNDVPSSELVDFTLEKLRTRQASPDAVVWLWRKDVEEAKPLLANPRVIFEALGSKVHGEFIRARKLLHDLIMSNQEFQSALMDGGTPQGIDAFVKTVKTVRALDLGDQKVLLVKICRLFPQAKKYVEERRKGPVPKKELPRMTSFRSMDQRRRELQEIINKKIPENSAAIAQARSYGDLRENFEFKAAKDQQRLLMARRRELQKDLAEIMPTEFSDVLVDRLVVPGVTVDLKVDGQTRSYHILGLWDSDPENNILSYDAPLGRCLLGNEVGSYVTLPQGEEAEIAAVRELPAEIKTWLLDHE